MFLPLMSQKENVAQLIRAYATPKSAAPHQTQVFHVYILYLMHLRNIPRLNFSPDATFYVPFIAALLLHDH